MMLAALEFVEMMLNVQLSITDQSAFVLMEPLVILK